MDYQEEMDTKALSLLYGKDIVEVAVYKTQLMEMVGHDVDFVLTSLLKRGFVQGGDGTGQFYSSSGGLFNSYKISQLGIQRYESIQRKMQQEENQELYNAGLFDWTKTAAVAGIIAAISALIAIYLVYHPPHIKP